MIRLKEFLLNENEEILMQQVGDVLSSLQSVVNDLESLGNRQLIRISTTIVNQIRKILDQLWPDETHHILRKLQKVAAALMRTIDGNEDLKQTVVACTKVLELAATKQDEPLNDLGSTSKKKLDEPASPM